MGKNHPAAYWIPKPSQLWRAQVSINSLPGGHLRFPKTIRWNIAYVLCGFRYLRHGPFMRVWFGCGQFPNRSFSTSINMLGDTVWSFQFGLWGVWISINRLKDHVSINRLGDTVWSFQFGLWRVWISINLVSMYFEQNSNWLTDWLTNWLTNERTTELTN